MADTITLVFNIICIVFLFFGMFWGFVRGAKKTLSRGLFLLLLSVVTIFVTAPLTKLILQIPINFDINTDGEVTRETMTVLEFLTQEIENLLGSDFIAKYPDFASAIVSIPLILVNAIMYVIVFWILKIVLFPLNALFTKLFFGTRKQKEAMGFASLNNSEYPNSDKSIEPLMDIYKESQSAPSNDGMFIKKEDDIAKSGPTGKTENVVTITQVETPKTKKELKKEKKEKKKAEKKANRKSKHRLLGAGAGILVGMLVLFNTMVPVFGIMDVLKENKSTTLKNITEEEMSLSSASNGITDDIIKGYELSAIGRVAKYIGMEQLGLITFDQVTSTKVDNKKIVLRNDINSLVTTVTKADALMGDYKKVSDKGIENITQEELDDLINGLDSVIKSSEEVVLVDALSSYLIPIAVEYIVYNEVQFSDNDVINQAVVDTLVAIAKENDIAIFEELKTLVDIAKYLSDQKLLYPIVTNKYDNILTVFDNLDDNFGETLTNKLFTLKTVNTTIPNILDMGLTIMDELTNFGYEKGSITTEKAKSTFLGLFSSIAEIGKSLSSDSSIYVTDSSLPAIGKLLDTFKDSENGIFNETTYEKLVDYAVQIIKTQTSSLIPDNLKNAFNNHLLRNVCEVESWQSEMQVIYEALQILRNPEYGILGKYIDNSTIRKGYDIDFLVKEETLINIGKALDTLEKSVLLGTKASISSTDTSDTHEYENTTFISIFTSILIEANESILSQNSSTTIAKLSDIVSEITNNLIESEHLYINNSTFWQEEMTCVSPLITQIYNMLDKSENIEITTQLGTALDKSTHSIMLGDDTTLNLMHTIIDIAKDEIVSSDYEVKNDDSLEDNIYILLKNTLERLDTTTASGEELYNIMKAQNNLDTETSGDGKFWEQEITSIIALMNIAEKAETITTIAMAKDISSDLDQVYESRIISDDDLNRVIASVLKQLRTNDSTGISGEINKIIDNIASDITTAGYFDTHEKEKFWQIELEHIDTLTSIKLSNEDEYNVLDNLSTIGESLDIVTKGTDSLRGSYLITENRIRKLLSKVVDEQKTTITNSFDTTMATTIENILTDIAKNIYDGDKTSQIAIVSFESELTHLQTLANIEIDSNIFSTGTDVESIRALGAKLDSIAYNLKTTESDSTQILSYDATFNSKIITRDMISKIVISAFDMAKVTETSADDTMFNGLIEDIQDSISSIQTNDKVIEWQRELSYIPTLVNLNSNEKYTLENASEKVGKYIDLIGFNISNDSFSDIQYNANNNIVGENIYSYQADEETKYYNSTIITRDILKKTINGLLDTFKATAETGASLSDEEEIGNELIENLKTKVSTTTTSDSQFYTGYTVAFKELNNVKTAMDKLASSITKDSIKTTNGGDIDTLLNYFQETRISAVLTTRKIALLIANKVNNIYTDETGFAETDAGKYLSSLISHYNENITNESTTAEEYTVSTSTNTFANPFATLKSKPDTLDY